MLQFVSKTKFVIIQNHTDHNCNLPFGERLGVKNLSCGTLDATYKLSFSLSFDKC